MKKFLILSILLLPNIAFAQTSRNPCYTTGAQSTQGIPNCVGVGTSTPLPVTVTNGGGGPAASNITQLNSTNLGSPSTYGTSPGAVNVPGVNAFVTNVNPNGAAASASSSPVVIATDQSVVPVGGNVADGTTDIGNSVKIGGLVNTGTPTAGTTGQRMPWWLGARGSGAVFLTSASGNPIVNVAQPAATGQSLGLGSIYVTAFTGLYNGTSEDLAVSVSGATAGTGVGVSAVSYVPTSSANAGVAPLASTAVAGSLILKASAGNLYGVEITAGATAGYMLLINSATVPADGAVVTPLYCKAVSANSSVELSWTAGPPAYFSTGIVAVFSTTGCYTKTASSTAFISGMAK